MTYLSIDLLIYFKIISTLHLWQLLHYAEAMASQKARASRPFPRKHVHGHGTERAPSGVVTQQELQERTFVFSLAVYRFVRPLFRDADTRHIAQQLVRCSTSVAANYRAACLARSGREWRARLGVVLEEADESSYWLEFVRRADLRPGSASDLEGLTDEAVQLA